MRKIEIEWLYDEVDCEQPGCSGDYQQGAIVKIDGEEIIKIVPEASCFGGTGLEDGTDLYHKILFHLGYEIDENSPF